MAQANDIVITGIGIVSSLAEGADAHWDMLRCGLARLSRLPPVIDEQSFAPYPIHPLIDVDFSKQIPRKGDQRQMEPWQRTGVYAAGLALDDAGIKGDLDRCSTRPAWWLPPAMANATPWLMPPFCARWLRLSDPQATLNELLPREIRPTLYLAQQSQLLAGNISIIHKVTGSSRTLKGEEIAGVQATELAHGADACGCLRCHAAGGGLQCGARRPAADAGAGAQVAAWRL